MLESPFGFENDLTEEDYQRVGLFALRFSHIEHTISNCLRVMLDMSMDEAVVMIFPIPLEAKLKKIEELKKIKPLNSEAEAALAGLTGAIKLLNPVRNAVIHGIINHDETRGHLFHLRSKQRDVALTEVQAAEQLTIYAAHAVYSLRFALGFKDAPGERHPLPDRPEIPEFLRQPNSTRKKGDQPRRSRRRSSRP